MMASISMQGVYAGSCAARESSAGDGRTKALHHIGEAAAQPKVYHRMAGQVFEAEALTASSTGHKWDTLLPGQG